MKQFFQAFTLKRAILTVACLGWLTLVLSDYGLLTGRRSMLYPAKFTHDKKAFVIVRCGYWIGLGYREVAKSGAPGSVHCPWLLHIENKWKSEQQVGDSHPQVLVSDR